MGATINIAGELGKAVSRLRIRREQNSCAAWHLRRGVEYAMAGFLKQIVYFLALAAVLASCTGADAENAALGAAKNWCQLHSPQYCSVNDEAPSAR